MRENVLAKVKTEYTAKPKIFGNLLAEVIRKGICSGCGACVSVCPVGIVTMKSIPGKDEQPTLTGKCILCGYCYSQCPWTEPKPLEVDVFGRSRYEKEEVGVVLASYSAKSRKEEILKVASDGGVVTSLLVYLFKNGFIDCAVCSSLGKEEPLKPKPKVVLTSDELLECAGTRYTVSQTIIGLGSAVDEYGKEKIAVVGTPCQIRAIRKMQYSPHGALKYGSKVFLCIGLFCMESFYYDKLIKEYLPQRTNLNKVSKFSIRKGKFIVEAEGKRVVDVHLDEVRPYVRGSCHICTDFTSELADISVGSVGSPAGWSTVLLRTEKAKRIFEDAVNTGYIECKPLDKVKPGKIAVIKLSNLKKEKSSHPNLKI